MCGNSRSEIGRIYNIYKNITLLEYKPGFPRKQPRTWAYTDSSSLETAVQTHVPA